MLKSGLPRPKSVKKKNIYLYITKACERALRSCISESLWNFHFRHIPTTTTYAAAIQQSLGLPPPQQSQSLNDSINPKTGFWVRF